MAGNSSTENDTDTHDMGRSEADLLRECFQRAADIMVILTPDGSVLDVNTRFEKVTGGTRDEVIGKKFTEEAYLTPASCEVIKSSLRRFFEDARSVPPFEIEMKTATGGFIAYEVRGTAIRHPDGTIRAVHAILRDISRRQRIETDLHELQEFLKSVINACPDPIFVKDRYHRWVILNDAFCELVGRPREALIGKSDYDVFPKEEADVSWKTDNDVFSSGASIESTKDVTVGDKSKQIVTTRKSLFVNPVTGAKFLFGIMHKGAQKKSDTKRWRQISSKIRRMVG